MSLLLRLRRSFLQKSARTIGRLALLLALLFMTLEMMRLRGWGVALVERVAASFGLSLAQFWANVSNVSVAAAFGLLILGLVATGLGRSRLLDEEEHKEEEIDVQEISRWIRTFETHQQAGRGT